MSRKKIVLKSSDGESFEVDEAADLESKTIAHMVEDDCVDNGVPLPNVTSEILAKHPRAGLILCAEPTILTLTGRAYLTDGPYGKM
ncbi:hypothetical protein DY000_02027626 [Brassica cretica]|uniref:SKP1 component POZ domain-containing protein n=1 Tax=Brassica cretica TaxID=69181 RepID=A0ABQ7E7T4_BRACR|nr:hypothetical protein DY000_02027626 [Brassica cretica]